MSTVLVVDDEPRIARLVADYLHQAGFSVLESGDGRTAVEAYHQHQPDLIVLDLGLPELDGLDVIRSIRTTSDVPIIILSARADETDRVVGLELGADDYVVKPFGGRELVARVRALLRRVDDAIVPDDVHRVGEVIVDLPKMRVTLGDAVIDLTPTEFQLVATMIAQPGRVFTRGQLLDAVHGVSFESYERAIDAHVKNIRRKFGATPGRPRYLLTVHGVGYKFTDEG
ncbi:MAG: response regulator transcription factor [Acidimicrobiales bacterium]|nr:response regulator transcription factor [Acidimicrobiales bacterium]